MNKKIAVIAILIVSVIGVALIPISTKGMNVDAQIKDNQTTSQKEVKAETDNIQEVSGDESNDEEIILLNGSSSENNDYQIKEEGEYKGCAYMTTKIDGEDNESIFAPSTMIDNVDESIEEVTSYDVLKEEAENSSVIDEIERQRASNEVKTFDEYTSIGSGYTVKEGRLKGQEIKAVCGKKVGGQCSALYSFDANPSGTPRSECSIDNLVASTYIPYDSGRYLYVDYKTDNKVDGYMINTLDIYTYDPVTQILIPSATDDEEMALNYVMSESSRGEPQAVPYLNTDKLKELKEKSFAKLGLEDFPLGENISGEPVSTYDEFVSYMSQASVGASGTYEY